MAIIKLDGGYNALPISYKRGNPIPLDTTAVWYDFEKLTAYAKTGVTAYVGQVLTYVDSTNNTATAYVIANVAGDLEPIGTVPVGDEKSIEVSEDGTISLKGVNSLVFERDILGEDDQPTGEKEEVQYQILMTKNGLIWVEPSKTTVEGLATLIDGLTQRVKALEDDRVTEAELAEAIKDFVTDGELTEAIKDFATGSELADAIKDFVTDGALADAISGVEAKIPTDNASLTNGAGYLVAADIANKADKSDTYTKTEVDGAIDAAVKGILGDDIDDAYNTLKEIQDILEGTNGEAIDGLLEVAEANKQAIEVLNGAATVDGSVDAKIAAAVAPLATTEALNNVKATAEAAQTAEEVATAIEAAFTAKDLPNTYAGKAATEQALGLKANAADVVANTTFEAFKTANTQAIADAVSAHETAVSGTYTTKQELINSEATAANTYATKATTYTKDEIDGKKFVNETVLASTLEGYQEVAPEGKVYAYTSDITSAVSTLTNGAIQEAKNAAAAAGTAADNAQDTANSALTKAGNNETEIANVKATVNTHDTTISTHTTDIANLKAHDTAHTALYEALKGIVDGHTTAIAGKAEQTALDAVSARVAINEAAIKTLNETTIPGINVEVAKKANAADVYTKTDADGKFLAKADYTPYDDEALTQRVKNIEDDYLKAADKTALNTAIAALAGEGNTATVKGNADAIAAIIGTDSDKTIRAIAKEEVELIVGAAPEALDTLEEVAAWIANDKSGAAAMAADIGKNKAAIANIYEVVDGKASGVLVTEIAKVEKKADDNKVAIDAINNTTTGILATAKKYTDDEIAKIHTVDNDTIQLNNNNNKAYVAKVSTDILVQGENELILCGGDSGYKAPAVEPEA